MLLNKSDVNLSAEMNKITTETVYEENQLKLNFDFGEMIITVDIENQDQTDHVAAESDSIIQEISGLNTKDPDSANQHPAYSATFDENSKKKPILHFLTEPNTPKKRIRNLKSKRAHQFSLLKNGWSCIIRENKRKKIYDWKNCKTQKTSASKESNEHMKDNSR